MKILSNFRWLLFGGISWRLRGFFIGLAVGIPFGVFFAEKVGYFLKFLSSNF